MTKYFCDLCGEPATKRKSLCASIPFGPPRSDESRLATIQPLITATINYSFEQRQDLFGGPPDLCQKCEINLVTKLLESLK